MHEWKAGQNCKQQISRYSAASCSGTRLPSFGLQNLHNPTLEIVAKQAIDVLDQNLLRADLSHLEVPRLAFCATLWSAWSPSSGAASGPLQAEMPCALIDSVMHRMCRFQHTELGCDVNRGVKQLGLASSSSRNLFVSLGSDS